MRTLSQITTAVRTREPFSVAELKYAVVAYDVLISRLEVANDPKQLQKYFEAAEVDVRSYVGPENDPENAEACEWYRSMIAVPDKVADQVEEAIRANRPGGNIDEEA